jgi:putative endonuclease
MHWQPGVQRRETVEDSRKEQIDHFDRKRPTQQRRTGIPLPLAAGNIIVLAMSETEQKLWYFYLARCCDGSLYSGIAVDPVKRMEVHNSGKGARYTRSRLPVLMVYSEPQPDQSSALKREAEVRKWSRKKKEELVDRKADENS